MLFKYTSPVCPEKVYANLYLVADDHEYEGRQHEGKRLYVPAEPVDPRLHAHELHGLFQARLLLVHYLLGGDDDGEHEADYDDEGQEAGYDGDERVVVVGRKGEPLQLHADVVRRGGELLHVGEVDRFLYLDKAFPHIAFLIM